MDASMEQQVALCLEPADPADMVWGSSIDDKDVGVYTRSCYLDLSRYHMQGLSTQDIAAALVNNGSPGPPLEMRRMSRTVVRLFYKSKADRDQVIASGLAHNSGRLAVDYPRMERQVTNLTIKGLPVMEEDNRVLAWLQSVGAKPISPIHRPTFKGTGIRTSGRQVRVVTRPGYVFHPFVKYRSPTCPSITVELWHPDFNAVCRRCLLAGHVEVDCKEAPAAPKKKRKPRKRRRLPIL